MEKTNKYSCTSFTIKIVAYITMLIDHIGAKIVLPYLNSIGQSYVNDPLYNGMRHIGRLAFVLFAFMIAEGMDQSHDKKKYIERLFLFALISEFPYDLSRGNFIDWSSQNVYFTLLAGAITIYLIQQIRNKISSNFIQILLSSLMTILIGIIGYGIHSDYGAWGIWLIVLLYVTKRNKMEMVCLGGIMLSGGYYSYRILVNAFSIVNFQWNTFFTWIQINQTVFLPNLTSEFYGFLSLLLLCFYNGEKGKTISKKITYSFYPIHLLLLGMIRMILFHS